MKQHFVRGEIALCKVAADHNTTVQEVRAEIQKAMMVGRNSSDPAVQAAWTQLMKRGSDPTPEAFIAFLAEQIKSDLQKNSM